MSGPGDSWTGILEASRRAAMEYGREEFAALARKVIFRLRRLPASGIYGDGRRHGTLWDEYRHEVEHGSDEMLERVWDQTLDPILDDIIDRITPHSAKLLSVYAASLQDEIDEAEVIGTVWREGMRNVLKIVLRWEADTPNWGAD